MLLKAVFLNKLNQPFPPSQRGCQIVEGCMRALFSWPLGNNEATITGDRKAVSGGLCQLPYPSCIQLTADLMGCWVWQSFSWVRNCRFNKLLCIDSSSILESVSNSVVPWLAQAHSCAHTWPWGVICDEPSNEVGEEGVELGVSLWVAKEGQYGLL